MNGHRTPLAVACSHTHPSDDIRIPFACERSHAYASPATPRPCCRFVTAPATNRRLPVRLFDDPEQQSARCCRRWPRCPLVRGSGSAADLRLTSGSARPLAARLQAPRRGFGDLRTDAASRSRPATVIGRVSPWPRVQWLPLSGRGRHGRGWRRRDRDSAFLAKRSSREARDRSALPMRPRPELPRCCWLPDQRRAGRIRPNPLRASATNRRLTRLGSVSLSRVRLVVRRRR
jgi:hypothetical protein